MKVSAAVLALIGTTQAEACPKWGLTVTTFAHDAGLTCGTADATKKETAETDVVKPVTDSFAWAECSLTTEAKAEVPESTAEDGTVTPAESAVAAEYSKTTCSATGAVVKHYSDDACTTEVGTDTTYTFDGSCTAAAADAYDYTLAVSDPPVVDCPTVTATFFDYDAEATSCTTAKADTTAAEAAMTFGTKECSVVTEAVAADDSATPPITEVAAVWGTTTCTEDKKITVKTFSDEGCSTETASGVYDYGSDACTNSGTDFAYKLAVEEPPAGSEHGVALRAASIAAFALIASQF